jgi:amino acid transporter
MLQVVFIGGFTWNSSAFGTTGVSPGNWSALPQPPIYSFPFFYEVAGLGLGVLAILLAIDGVVSPSGTLSQYMASTARVLYGTSKEGVWASLNFHEFVSNPQPLGFNRVTGKPVTPPPL